MDGARAASPAPVLGADSAAVLTGMLGLSAAEVGALADNGVVGAPDASQAAAS